MSITLVTSPVSRGLVHDVRYTSYNTGGTTVVSRYLTTAIDIFDDSPTAEDFLLIYASNPFYEFDITFTGSTVPISGTDVVLAYEYYDGSSWTALPGLTDGTSGLTTTGTISWTIPSDWEMISRLNENPDNTVSTTMFAIRVRLVSFTSITEGGRIANYPGITQDYIDVSGEDFDFDDIYDADVAGGWGVVTKDYNNFHCSVGLYVHATSTWNQSQGNVQIGSDRAGMVIFSLETTTRLLFNVPTDGRVIPQSGQTNLIIGSRGTTGSIYFYASRESEVNNTSIKVLDEQFYCRLAIRNYSDVIAKWKNVIFSKCLPYDGHNFDRVNFQNIQYILTLGSSVYNNCFMASAFATDPGYDSVVTRPIYDSKTTDSYWRAGVFPIDGKQNRYETISGTWNKSSLKYVNCGKNINTYRNNNLQQYLELGSNFLQFTVKDKSGDDVEAKIYITDQFGNNCCWEETDLEIDSGSPSYFPQSATDTSLTLVDATGVEVDDQYLCFGEIFTVESITGNVLTITRGDESSARRFRSSSNKNGGLKLRKRVPYYTIDGSLTDVYLQEYMFHKYTVDGGTTTTGHLEKYFSPFTIKVEAQGYKTWMYEGSITNETTFNIILKPQKQLAITQDGVFINTDPADITDDLCLIKL